MNDALRLILQNLENLIRFRVGTMAQYEALASKDEGTLYFITDRGVFYKGAQMFVGIKEAAVVTEGTGTSQVHVLSLTPSLGDTLTFTTTSQDALQAMLAALRSELVTIIETQATDEVMGRVYLSDAVDSELNAETGGTAATPKAVKSALEIAKEYADGLVAVNDAMVLKGTIGDTEDGADVSALPTTDYKTGWTYIVVTAGTYAGNVCEIGDKIMCVNDYNADTASDEDWSVFQANIDGAVTSADQLADGSVIVGAGGNSVKTLDNGASKQVLTIDPDTLKPVWADNIAQGLENPFRITGSVEPSRQGWVRLVSATYRTGGTIWLNNRNNTAYARTVSIEYTGCQQSSHTPYLRIFNPDYNLNSGGNLYDKIRVVYKTTGLLYIDIHLTSNYNNTIHAALQIATDYNMTSVSLPLTMVDDDEVLDGYIYQEYDLVKGIWSNLPYVSTEGLIAPKLGNGERTMDVEDIIARDSVNAIPAGVSSITQLRTGDSTYPYAFIDAVSPLAITSNNTEVYGLSIAKSASVSYTYNGVEYSVTNPNASYAVSVFLIQDSDNMFLKGTTHPFNVCNVVKSYVTIGNGRILAVRSIADGIYELIVNQQNTTTIEYPSALTLRMFKKSSTGDYNGFTSVASGQYSVASGGYSVASGIYSVASANSSVASGQYSVASGASSVASGRFSVASGGFSVASGYSSVASGYSSVASGFTSVASGNHSTAMNRETKATGQSQTVVGQFNATADDAYFIVGNGTSDTARSNAMKVTNTGYVKATGIGNDTRNIPMADIIARDNLDTEVTEDSTNPVTSQGISNAIEDAITEVVNQLVWQTIGE